ncbi:hypothetical protein [Pseudomonas sp. LH1G9]|uniref:hypothetical protein n=1 Tax=Pseudomonas sp. LH1G9 TaxID=2083055 RepID=UPI000CF332EA|nr:hypothetical protein [Pseudomonas sp. LH1G9]
MHGLNLNKGNWMRNAIKANLEAWVEKLESQQNVDGDYLDHDFFLDYKLLGVATFLKQIAFEEDDMELLAIASKAEMLVTRKIQADEEAEEEGDLLRQQQYDADERIRTACYHYFYTEPAFAVDMSKYEALIEASAKNFSDPYKLSSLRRYVEQSQVLAKLYDKVKARLLRGCDEQATPTFEDVARAFDAELPVIYRRADAHVERTIAQYAAAPAPASLG